MDSQITATAAHRADRSGEFSMCPASSTMSRYSHVFSGQESEAVAKLPDFSMVGQQQAKATGTDGETVQTAKNTYRKTHSNLTEKHYSGCQESANDGNGKRESQSASLKKWPCRNSMKKAMLGIKKEPVSTHDTSSSLTEEEGFEPPVRCRTTVFKTATISRSVTPPSLLF